MKLSEIKGEDALEAVANIIEPLAKISVDKKFMAEYKSNKPKLLLIKYLLKEHKHEVVEILAALNLQAVDEYMETINLVTLPYQILEAINDPELQVLFQSQSQTEKTSFGSVTESTGADVK